MKKQHMERVLKDSGWWRNFIRQAAAAGFIRRIVKTAKFGQSCGVYASLSVDDKGRKAIDEKTPVMLPVYVDQSSCFSLSGACKSSDDTDMEVDTPSR